MKILIFGSAEHAADRVAQEIVATVSARPGAVLGLATGGTMPPVYRRLAEACRAGAVSFSRATSFNLDEYIGLAPDHPCSYRHFMTEQLFKQVDFAPERTHLPKGDAPDPVVESARYEGLIGSAGPIDLQLLGLGGNGHIGFNEPTSSLGSRTRIKTLTAATRDANRRFLAPGEEPPKYAITVGIKTILEARAIILLATGAAKADAVAAMIEGPLGAHCPATALQLHPEVTVVLDQLAASKLALKKYYFEVHPDGRESIFG